MEKEKLPKVKIPAYMKDRVAPNAIDVEIAVLGETILERHCIPVVASLLKTQEVFHLDTHKLIYQAILDVHNNNQTVDIIAVTERLKKMGELDFVGGPFYITQLTNRVASSANVEWHCRILLQEYMKREAIRIGHLLLKDSHDTTTDVFDLINKAVLDLGGVIEANVGDKEEGIDEIAKRVIIEGQDYANKKINHAITGYTAIEEKIGYLSPKELIIVAARPGMGKSALALCIARNVAIDQGLPVAFFSVEMSTEALMTRFISLETGVDGDAIKKGKLTFEELKRIEGILPTLKSCNLRMEYCPGITITKLRNKAIYLKNKFGIKLIVVDYLQLMRGSGNVKGVNREAEISEISRGLKMLAGELEIPVIALSQLSREVEKRGGNRIPQLSDLRESGAIEQDADQVWFLYRPEQYKLYEDADGRSTKGMAQVIFAKLRNGALGTIWLRYIDYLTKFIGQDSDVMIPAATSTKEELESTMQIDDDF